MLENIDIDRYGAKKADHVIGYSVKCIIDMLFKDETMAVQAQILKSLLTSKKLKEAMTLLGIPKSTKVKKWKKMWYNV